MTNLSIAKCCGACKHVNKPKTPEDHAPHYTVAKTQRWCYKHNIPTVREAVCDEGFELPTGRCAAKTNLGRALTQMKRLDRVLSIINWMKENNIDSIPYYDNYFSPKKNMPCGEYKFINGKLMYQNLEYPWDAPDSIRVRDESAVKKLEDSVNKFKATQHKI